MEVFQFSWMTSSHISAFQSQEQWGKPRFHLISPVVGLSIHWVHGKQRFATKPGSVKHKKGIFIPAWLQIFNSNYFIFLHIRIFFCNALIVSTYLSIAYVILIAFFYGLIFLINPKIFKFLGYSLLFISYTY
jgi:hypothetical protein